MTAYAKPSRRPSPGGYFGKTKNKFGNESSGGYDSKLERAVGDWLELRQKNGEIKDLVRQHVVVLQDGNRSLKITWRVDFAYFDNTLNEFCLSEAKGFETDVYKMKLKMFRANPKCRLEIWGGTYKNPKVIEVIEADASRGGTFR